MRGAPGSPSKDSLLLPHCLLVRLEVHSPVRQSVCLGVPSAQEASGAAGTAVSDFPTQFLLLRRAGQEGLQVPARPSWAQIFLASAGQGRHWLRAGPWGWAGLRQRCFLGGLSAVSEPTPSLDTVGRGSRKPGPLGTRRGWMEEG